MTIGFQTITVCDVIVNISSFLSLKDILCLSLTNKEIFDYRFYILKNCDFLDIFKVEYGSSFLKLLFNSVMASSYHLTPSVPDIDNSVLITKIQATYSILPVEICEETLKNISSNFVLSKYFKGEKVSRKIQTSLSVADVLISRKNWYNSIIPLSVLYEGVFLAHQGANRQLVDALSSTVFVPCLPSQCHIICGVSDTITFLIDAISSTYDAGIKNHTAVVIRSVLTFYLFSFIVWFCEFYPEEAKNGKLAPVINITQEKAVMFKLNINESKMPKYMKKLFIEKFDFVKTKIDNM